MPKRKCDSDIEKLSKKFRELERKLKRVKRQRFSSRESRQDPVPSEHSYEATENPMDIFSDDDFNVEEPRRLASVVRAISPNESVAPRAESPAPSSQLAHARAPSRAPQSAAPRPPNPPLPPPPLDTKSYPVTEPCTSAATANDTIIIADDDVIDILGNDPTHATEFGRDIYVGLANRLEYIIINGLDSDARKELGKKHLMPANCPRMIPPLLNPEIKAALPEASVKRDKGIENRQKQLATALACLTDVMTTKMQEKNKEPALLKQLMDAAKLMCDTLHSDSVKRRYFALSSSKKDINDHLMQTKIDKYLFGETLSETIRTAKAVTKSGADIKLACDKNKKTTQPQPSTSRGLNWKAPPPTRRQSGPQRSRQTFPSAGVRMPPPPPPASRPPPPASRPPPPPHASWSRPSRYQLRTTHRQ